MWLRQLEQASEGQMQQEAAARGATLKSNTAQNRRGPLSCITLATAQHSSEPRKLLGHSFPSEIEEQGDPAALTTRQLCVFSSTELVMPTSEGAHAACSGHRS